MLQFDEATTRLLDNAYQGADVTRRRAANLRALSPVPGDTILDLGCGSGLLSIELARAVGAGGRVVGLDPSDDMLSAARARCAEFDTIDLIEGTAENLPFAENEFDKAVSLQVFEYFSDARPALRELYRVLRPGGRLVIGDMHWDTLCWHSAHPDRMSRMIKIWDLHLADRCVPAILPEKLRECGFEADRVEPLVFCDTTLRPDGQARMIMRLMSAYAIQNGHMSEEETNAWSHEQHSLAEQGRFFMSITHFIWVARKP